MNIIAKIFLNFYVQKLNGNNNFENIHKSKINNYFSVFFDNNHK